MITAFSFKPMSEFQPKVLDMNEINKNYNIRQLLVNNNT